MIKKSGKFTVELTGIDEFKYLKSRFNATDEEAIKSMKDNKRDVSFYDDYKQEKENKLAMQLIEEKKQQIERQKLINEYSVNDPQVMAVSKSALVTPEEAIELLIDDDWICLTDEEADEMARDYILQSVWAFNPSFLSAHSDIDESVFKLLQEKCEGSNDAILRMIKDKDYFVEDAINSDGREHFISNYDGEEHEHKINNEWYYCYRMN